MLKYKTICTRNRRDTRWAEVNYKSKFMRSFIQQEFTEQMLYAAAVNKRQQSKKLKIVLGGYPS